MEGGEGGRFRREGIYEYIWMIHTVVQQKLIQHHKVIIPQLKKKKKCTKVLIVFVFGHCDYREFLFLQLNSILFVKEMKVILLNL